jgi:hypothetical protein
MTAPDPGAAIERTRLAWRRTILSAGAVALLCVRPAFAQRPGTLAVLLTAAAMGGWAALTALAYRRAGGLRIRPPHSSRRTIVATAGIAVGFAILGGLVVVV